jgi:large subunit ribosomal protein L9
MRVILRENIENLGKKGDIVKVAAGYGRNFLIPKKMATEITPTNAKMIAIEQASLQKGLEQEMSTYHELIQNLDQVSLSFSRKTSEKDVIFGSVSATDIRDSLEGLGFSIEKKKIILDEPIKRLGHYTVPIKVFHEERAEIKVEVVKEGAPLEEIPPEDTPAVKEEKDAEPTASEEPATLSTEEAAPEAKGAEETEPVIPEESPSVEGPPEEPVEAGPGEGSPEETAPEKQPAESEQAAPEAEIVEGEDVDTPGQTDDDKPADSQSEEDSPKEENKDKDTEK